MKLRILAAFILAGMLGKVEAAHASFHLWQPDQIYSDAIGTVQFLEFTSGADGQQVLTNTTLVSTATGNNYHFTTDLPSSSTSGREFLVGTPGYAALPGVPAPDYILPFNHFFDLAADSVYLQGTVMPPLTYSAGQLPTDGVNSLFFDGSNLTTGANFPTNFAGVNGTIAVPEPATCAALGFAGLLILRRRRA